MYVHVMFSTYSHSSAVQDTAQCDREVSAAVVLQAVWRGRTVRQRVAAVCWAAVRVQAVWRGCVVRRSVQLIREERRKQNWAATVIQVGTWDVGKCMYMYVVCSVVTRHCVLICYSSCIQAIIMQTS